MKSSRKYVVFCLHNRQWKLRVSIALDQFVIVLIRESILARMTSRETEKKKKVKTNRLHLLVGGSLIKHAGLHNLVRSGNGARAKQRCDAGYKNICYVTRLRFVVYFPVLTTF